MSLVSSYGRDCRQSGDQCLKLGEPLLRCDVVRPLGHQCLQPGQLVIGVIAVVLTDAAALELEDACDAPVQQTPVMGNQQHGPREVDEGLLQPLQTRVIQVVARLIQNKQPRIHHQGTGERQAVPFPTGKQRYRRRRGCSQAYLLQDPFGLPSRLVPIDRVIPIPGRLVALQGIGHLMVVGPGQGALGGPKRPFRGRDLPQQVVPDLHRRRGFQLLRNMSDAETGCHDHTAVARLLHRQQQVQNGGLAGAVRTDQPHFVTGVDLERDIPQDVQVPVVLGYVVKAHHRSALPGRKGTTA